MSNASATANQAELDTAKAAGKAEGFKEGEKAAKERITGILACENAKERPVAALAAAIDTDMSVEQANTFLGKLAVEKAETADGKKDEQKDGKGDNAQKFDSAMKDGKQEISGNKSEKQGEADADSAEEALDIAAAVGIPGLRQRKQA